MENLIEAQRVKAACQQVIDERDYWRKEASILKQAITELQFEKLELERLVDNAHRQIKIDNPKRLQEYSIQSTWIGTWKCSPQEYPALVCVEDAWRNGHLQQALNQMPTMLERKDFGHHHQVNARLLYCALISTSGVNLMLGLHYAEEALQLATRYHLQELAGKAQFHRGLCYLFLNEPANASQCFWLASHVDGHTETIKECKIRADKQVDDLPEDHPMKSITSDFKYFPDCKTDATNDSFHHRYAAENPVYT